MRLTRLSHVLALAILVGLASSSAHGQTNPTQPVPDFCFLHISDMHISPHPADSPRPSAKDRGGDDIAWICAQAAKPQTLGPFGIQTPPPAFIIDTGDLTEYGVINDTWDILLTYFKPLTIPLYVTPGNHDNTWTAMTPIMRRRYKSDLYSFEASGCHFASIDTATPQEPLPSIDQRALTWLAADLKKVPGNRPIFLFCHHPLSSTEFAKPFEQLRLLELLEEHNVVLVLMGHGHNPRHERWSLTDSVMGGSTYGPEAGYSVVSVQNGVLRVAYRFHNEKKPMAALLEKPIAPAKKPTMQFDTLGGNLTARTGTATLRGPRANIRIRLSGGQPGKVTASIDDSKTNSAELHPETNGSAATDLLFAGNLPTAKLTPGMHFVRVIADFGEYQLDRGRQVLLPDRRMPPPEVIELPAGMKAGPVFLGRDIIVATTAGQVLKISFGRPQPTQQLLFDAGVEILHPPVVANNVIYFSAAEKGVFAISPEGRSLWQWQSPKNAPVYGTPALAGDRLFVGDLEGFVHAIDRATGKTLWSRRHAQFSIEQPLLLYGKSLYFGAWDGFVYCVDAQEGGLKWKQPGPAAHREERSYKSRYYAPADCTPVVIGDRLFVTDRAYVLGSYSLDGEYLGEIAGEVAAIGPSQDHENLYARGLVKGLTRYDGDGKRVWSAPVPLGRFPLAPTEASGKVYACSNKGLLSAIDAATGKVLWDYQVTPQLYVMAAVLADAEGNAYVAGMDGTVTKIHRTGR